MTTFQSHQTSKVNKNTCANRVQSVGVAEERSTMHTSRWSSAPGGTLSSVRPGQARSDWFTRRQVGRARPESLSTTRILLLLSCRCLAVTRAPRALRVKSCPTTFLRVTIHHPMERLADCESYPNNLRKYRKLEAEGLFEQGPRYLEDCEQRRSPAAAGD